MIDSYQLRKCAYKLRLAGRSIGRRTPTARIMARHIAALYNVPYAQGADAEERMVLRYINGEPQREIPVPAFFTAPLNRPDWRDRVSASRLVDHIPSVRAGVRVFRDGRTEAA